MRWNISTLITASAIVLALGCLLAAIVCERHYVQAHREVGHALVNAYRNGTFARPKPADFTSPETYYQRARTLRKVGAILCLIGLVTVCFTRKWVPGVILTAILLVALLTGGNRY